jgi:hypothetical protein
MQHATLILRLDDQQRTLKTLVRALESSAREAADAQETLALLLREHERMLEQLEAGMHGTSPRWRPLTPLSDPAVARLSTLPLQELLERIDETRAALKQHLKTLPPAAWRLTGAHPQLGEIPLPLWLELFLLHEAHHLHSLLVLIPQLRQRSA